MKLKHLVAIISILLTSGFSVSSTEFETRVIGGETTTGSWPFMVSLYKDNAFFCGGTLISSQHILTAAHCVNGVSASRLGARIGSNTLATYISDTVAIRSVIIHPQFSAMTIDNDLAILTLEFPVAIQPLSMTTVEPTTQATPAPFFVLGWGDTDPTVGVNNPNELQQANLNIVNFSDCKGIYGNALTTNMICATESFNATTNKDACQGDSGGPLIEDLGSGVFKQVGIVSWGDGCGNPSYPGVYTDVSEYKESWIDPTLSGLNRKKSGGSLDLFLLFLLIPLGLKRLHS